MATATIAAVGLALVGLAWWNGERQHRRRDGSHRVVITKLIGVQNAAAADPKRADSDEDGTETKENSAKPAIRSVQYVAAQDDTGEIIAAYYENGMDYVGHPSTWGEVLREVQQLRETSGFTDMSAEQIRRVSGMTLGLQPVSGFDRVVEIP